MIKNFVMTILVVACALVWYHFTFGAGYGVPEKEFYVVNMEKAVRAKTVMLYKASEYGDIDDAELDRFYADVVKYVVETANGTPVMTARGALSGGIDVTDAVFRKFGLDDDMDLDAVVAEKSRKVAEAQRMAMDKMAQQRRAAAPSAATLPGFEQ